MPYDLLWFTLMPWQFNSWRPQGTQQSDPFLICWNLPQTHFDVIDLDRGSFQTLEKDIEQQKKLDSQQLKLGGSCQQQAAWKPDRRSSRVLYDHLLHPTTALSTWGSHSLQQHSLWFQVVRHMNLSHYFMVSCSPIPLQQWDIRWLQKIRPM